MDDETRSFVQKELDLLQKVHDQLESMTATKSDPELYTAIAQLDTSKQSGQQTIEVPINARYVNIVNNTAAAVYLSSGRVNSQTPDALPAPANTFVSYPVKQQGVYTLFWSGTVTAPQNTVLVQFSDMPFQNIVKL